jgi:hypothetical protein
VNRDYGKNLGLVVFGINRVSGESLGQQSEGFYSSPANVSLILEVSVQLRVVLLAYAISWFTHKIYWKPWEG